MMTKGDAERRYPSKSSILCVRPSLTLDSRSFLFCRCHAGTVKHMLTARPPSCPPAYRFLFSLGRGCSLPYCHNYTVRHLSWRCRAAGGRPLIVREFLSTLFSGRGEETREEARMLGRLILFRPAWDRCTRSCPETGAATPLIQTATAEFSQNSLLCVCSSVCLI